MKIAIGADHGGFELKTKLFGHLQSQGHQVLDVGTDSTAAVDYPVFARKVAEAVSSGQAERGVMIDGAGIGSSMVANKVPGVRAAMAYDLSSARNGREHNDANLLTLGAGLIGANLAGPDRRRLPEHRMHRTPPQAAGGHDHRRRRRCRGSVMPRTAAAVPVGLADLSEDDLARIVNRLTGLLGGTGDAWHGGPCVGSCPDTARQFIELGARTLSHGPGHRRRASPRTWPATSITPS